MKKVVLGTGMLVSGAVGFTGIIAAVVSKGTLNGNWPDAIIYERLIIPFSIFILLAVLGLVTAVIGIREKD